MIVLRITSGLGNQMFQYAFYTLLTEKYKDTEVLADISWFKHNHEHREYELEKIFGSVSGSLFEIKKANTSTIVKMSGKIPNFFNGMAGAAFDKIRRIPNRILKDTLLKKRAPFILEQDQDLFFEKVMNLDTSKDWYIQGFFIEEMYYGQILDKVKERLVFPAITEASNMEYEKLISSCDSVSLHVRRGDYLSDLYKDKFLTLGRGYYEKAVNYVSKEIISAAKAQNREADIKFFVFSDDEQFVRDEFTWLDNKVIVTGNTGDKSFRDMQLMSLCKHNITANSTFSQWGALLNSNDGHITIYPKVYMKDSDNEKKTAPRWVQL